MKLPAALDSGLRLALVAGMAALAIALVFAGTHDRIVDQERQAELTGIAQVLPPELHDNDPTVDVITVQSGDYLGTARPHKVYRARRDQEPTALALQTTAPDGYNGPIELLVGIRYDGAITGVRVISHRETPGLGDGIEHDVSTWIESFEGRSLDDPPPAQWTVKKNGGAFDQFTGATITPRAVVRAVHRALAYYALHRDELFAGDGEPDPSSSERE